MKALLHYRASPGFAAQLAARAEAAGVEAVIVEEADEAGFAREIADTEVLLHVLKPVTAAMLEQAPRLKLVQKLGVGVNTIDLVACRERGVAVANMPGTNSQAVAEMTLALMLAVLRRLPYFDALVREGEGWRPDLAVLDSVGELCGRTVGFVGYGGVPSRVAPAVAALGARVIYTARSAKTGTAGAFVSLNEVVEQSDILSLHIPLTEETRGMIGGLALWRMKPGSILINTARGELVDQAALCEALGTGQLGGAGLDVFNGEPVDPDDPVLASPKVVLAPHVAWLTPETLARSLDVALENCRRARDGTPLLCQVA
ncbi:2-hydroxyacid dehydrogenase [Phenylobacterium sp.]|uniref:2-hydroxyacid dehydrogenase n=1 Tax=Phenylobacterium sp. TaxID=1871053 RepID=UPI003982DAA5